MKGYPKINSIYKRDKKGKFLMEEFSRPEFEYLQNNIWIFTEKIDGTNIRVIWIPESRIEQYPTIIESDTQTPKSSILTFKGRTDRAQIPPFLLKKLNEIFTITKMQEIFPDKAVCLYGEGYGARIQKGGGKYIPDGVDFILFDVKIDFYWLKDENIRDIARKLGIKVVPIIHRGTLHDAIQMCRKGFKSIFGDFIAEGIVLKPEVDLLMQNGERVITKVKYKDFNWKRKDRQDL
ncbi:MAG: RNA ligase family protein [Candidatus Helarchaeota archaeon]